MAAGTQVIEGVSEQVQKRCEYALQEGLDVIIRASAYKRMNAELLRRLLCEHGVAEVRLSPNAMGRPARYIQEQGTQGVPCIPSGQWVDCDLSDLEDLANSGHHFFELQVDPRETRLIFHMSNYGRVSVAEIRTSVLLS